jgi:hypothetical protein
LENKPLVLDREFSYEDLLSDMVSEGINFVIRLKAGNKLMKRETLLLGEGARDFICEGRRRVSIFRTIYTH